MAIYESVLASPSPPPAYPNVKYQIKNTQKNRVSIVPLLSCSMSLSMYIATY